MLPPSFAERLPLSSTTGNATTSTTESHLVRKRKHDHGDPTDAGPTTFGARYLPAKDDTVIFSSVTLLARACLPLAWLDTSARQSQRSSASVFEAGIDFVQQWEQRVLVARQLPNGGLYAIERVGVNTYISCRLQSWVSEQWCDDAAIGNVAECALDDLLGGKSKTAHARTSSVSSLNPLPTPKSPKRPTHRRGALARQSILNSKDSSTGETSSELSNSPSIVKPPFLPLPVTMQPLPVTPTAQIEHQNIFENTLSAVVAPLEQQSLSTIDPCVPDSLQEDPLAPERLRNLYFEHLYRSKTSLAFFVKGPLSRARAHLRTLDKSSTSILQLADFYRQCILPIAKIDVKYKESVSRVVNQESGQGGEWNVQKKKAAKKKTKLGKDSLWPNEHEFIQRWWSLRDVNPGVPAATDRAAELRRHTSDLRMRETKMQLLLILEVMLLDLAASSLSERPLPVDPDIKVETVENDSSTILNKTPSKRSKKERDLSGEMETIIDRLCIWHTVSFGDLVTSESKDKNIKSNDSLQDFCKEVLIPFYSAKLPEQIKNLCRKLGGNAMSPDKPKLVKSKSLTQLKLGNINVSASKTASGKPGKPVTKRTLERVLSEDQTRRHHSPPVLSRSSTGPMNPIIPTLKREVSERPLSRGGMLSKSVSFTNREIDLVADTQHHETKRQKLDKLAQQKRDLDAAIQALRKPSRSTVAGAFMDEVEQRKTQATPQVVHITATPRARRVQYQKDLEPELPPMPNALSVYSHDMIVPSSTIKPRFGVPMANANSRSSATKRAVLSAIHETPSRGIQSKTSNPLSLASLNESHSNQPTTIAATPQPRSRLAPLSTNIANQSDPTNPFSDHAPSSSQGQSPTRNALKMARSQRPVLFTPLKRSDVRIEDVFRDAPEIPASAGKAMDRAMGGARRGVEMDLDLGAELMSDLVAMDSSPGVIHAHTSSAGMVASMSKRDRSGDIAGKAETAEDEGDIYAQLGWNDDLDL